MVWVNCQKCGVEFNKPPSKLKKTVRSFCSKPCYDKAQTEFPGKNCVICGSFFKVRGNMKGYSTCPDPVCRSKKVQGENNPSWAGGIPKAKKLADKRRKDPFKRYMSSVWTLYKLTEEQYLSMVESQKGLCGICGHGGVKLMVDHCHHSGVVRGLLCAGCNSGLGHFRDDENRLEKAVSYLKRHGLHIVPGSVERSSDGGHSK